MCGNMALIPVEGEPLDIAAINKMIEDSRQRGRNATGLFIYNNPNDYALIKEPGFFLSLPDTPEVRNARLVLGHVRKATKGSFMDNSANHPHILGDFVMIHNGTSNKALELCEKLGLTNVSKSDSYALLSLIVHCIMHGLSVEDSIAAVLSNMSTSDTYSILLFDMRDERLYMARETGRPMVIAPLRNALICASQSEFIKDNFETDYRFNIPVQSVLDTKPNMIHCFDIKTMKFHTLRDCPKISINTPCLNPHSTTQSTIIALPANSEGISYGEWYDVFPSE